MRFKPLFNIIGALLTILGSSMIAPILISFFYNEYDLNGFLYSSVFCIFSGFPMWYLTRYKRSLTNRDGFAIVTLSWIITAVVGALPFYLSGAIPNFWWMRRRAGCSPYAPSRACTASSGCRSARHPHLQKCRATWLERSGQLSTLRQRSQGAFP